MTTATGHATATGRATATRRLALGAVVALVLTACAGPPEALRLAPLNTRNTLTLAADSGHLDTALAEAGTDLDRVGEFPAFAPAAEALVAGQADMTSGSSTSLVAALRGAPDLVVFAVEENDRDTQGIVAAPGTGIESVADLAGRTVAINEGGTGDYLLRLALAGAGMTVDDVVPVPLAPPEAAAAFTAGQVDAWATWDQYLAAARLIPDAHLVATAADIDAANPTVHVVSRAFLDAHPDAVVAAFDALVAQAEAVVADPGVLAQAYLDAGATPEVAAAVIAARPPRVVPADDAFAADLAAVARFYAEQGLTDGTVDVSAATVDVRDL